MTKKLIPMGWLHVNIKENTVIDMGSTKGVVKTKDGKPEVIICGGLKKKRHVHIFSKKDGNMGVVITNEGKRGTEEEHVPLSKEEFEKVKE